MCCSVTEFQKEEEVEEISHDREWRGIFYAASKEINQFPRNFIIRQNTIFVNFHIRMICLKLFNIYVLGQEGRYLLFTIFKEGEWNVYGMCTRCSTLQDLPRLFRLMFGIIPIQSHFSRLPSGWTLFNNISSSSAAAI